MQEAQICRLYLSTYIYISIYAVEVYFTYMYTKVLFLLFYNNIRSHHAVGGNLNKKKKHIKKYSIFN